MHSAQSGIFALGTSAHSYLEFDLDAHADPPTMVQAVANLRKPTNCLTENLTLDRVLAS